MQDLKRVWGCGGRIVIPERGRSLRCLQHNVVWMDRWMKKDIYSNRAGCGVYRDSLVEGV